MLRVKDTKARIEQRLGTYTGLLQDIVDTFNEVDGRRVASVGELRRAEDAAERKREREAVHGALDALGNPVHAEWYEDPDAVQPASS